MIYNKSVTRILVQQIKYSKSEIIVTHFSGFCPFLSFNSFNSSFFELQFVVYEIIL